MQKKTTQQKAADPTTCGDCRCFVAEPHEDLGLCKRYPPVVVVVAEEPLCTFPSTARDEPSCGEFAQRLQS